MPDTQQRHPLDAGDQRGLLFGAGTVAVVVVSGLILGEEPVPALAVMIGVFAACVSAGVLMTAMVGLLAFFGGAVLAEQYGLDQGQVLARAGLLTVATGLAMFLSWERMGRDRTTQLLAERNELAARFELLMREAPVGFALLDRELRCVAVNQKLADIDGAAIDEHLGRRPTEVRGAGKAALAVQQVLAGVLMSGAPVLNMAVSEGEPDREGTREFEVSYFPVTELDGISVAGVGISVTDVTERNRSSRYLEELLRDRDHVARALQDALLPPTLPESHRLEFAASYLPAGTGADIGGDFYDVFETVDNCWHVVLGDICGKGLEAATQIGLARHTLRAAAVDNPLPEDTLKLLNTVLVQQGDNDRFLTAVHLIIDLSHGTVSCMTALGGHPPPYLVRNGEVTEIGEYGPLLGIHEEVDVPGFKIELHPGDLVVAYTDGLIEDRERRFGEDDLRTFLAGAGGAPAAEVVTGLEMQLAEHRPGPPADDVAIVAVRVTS
jgi:sigma-B regulation protein RsbU (phosphoserine phosphatase)